MTLRFRLGRVNEKPLAHCTNGADLHVNERQKKRHYRARSTEERRRRRILEEEEWQIAIFFTSGRGGAYINCTIIAMLYTHLIGNQP